MLDCGVIVEGIDNMKVEIAKCCMPVYGDKIVGMADIVYYNSSDAMNEAAFAKRWPGFMIPVDTAFEGIDISTLSMSKKKSTELPKLSDLIDLEKAAPVAVGVGIGSFALLVGLLILLLTRKKRR